MATSHKLGEKAFRDRRKKPSAEKGVLLLPSCVGLIHSVRLTVLLSKIARRYLGNKEEALELVATDDSLHLLLPLQKIFVIKLDRNRVGEGMGRRGRNPIYGVSKRIVCH